MPSCSISFPLLARWLPKIKFNGPVPLVYENKQFDLIVRYLGEPSSGAQTQPYRLVYLGYRAPDTIQLHERYQGANSYPFKFQNVLRQNKEHMTPFVEHFETTVAPKKLPFVGVNRLHERDALHFDSDFEGGNLDAAIDIGLNQYDLYMRPDSNTRGHCHWYHFRVRKMRRGVTYHFSICNFTKKKCLYARGMKPFVSSQRKSGGAWEQGGSNVLYELRPTRFKFIEQNLENPKVYFVLSFDYLCESDEDVVSFAYGVPYTFSDLLAFLRPFSSNTKLYKQEKLCQSMSGLDVPLITITGTQLPPAKALL